MNSRRPSTPPPFPSPAQAQQSRGEDLAPAIAQLSERVNKALAGSPNAQGEYVVYLPGSDPEAAIDAVRRRLEKDGWVVRKERGVCNDADLVIQAA